MHRQREFRVRRPRRARRSGAVLVWCALLLPVLVAMVGLTVDGGLMLAAYREAQNAADAAAIAAAYDLSLGKTAGTATSTAETFVTDSSHNNLSGASVTVNIPPSVTTYTAYQKTNYAEVIVSYPITTHFMQVLPGFSSSQTVTARAIAGYEAIAGGEGVMALTPNGNGLTTSGNGALQVNGPVWVNSTDSNGLSAGKDGIYATDFELVENAGQPSNIFNYATSGSMTANIGQSPQPDYLAYLPTPTTANGVDTTVRTVPAGGGTLQPGIYNGGIKVSGNGAVYTMQPGIYVMQGGGFQATGNVTVSGSGVMIYNTGSDYTATTGAPDNTDPVDLLNATPPTVAGDNFDGLSLNTNVTLTPINTALYTYSNPAIAAFNGMVYYQRRANTKPATLSGGGGGQLSGTMYGKWALLSYSGHGITNAQFVFNSIGLSGNGTITIQTVGTTVGTAPRVYLVE
jgi:Flp pilus assembly protein TadG